MSNSKSSRRLLVLMCLVLAALTPVGTFAQSTGPAVQVWMTTSEGSDKTDALIDDPNKVTRLQRQQNDLVFTPENASYENTITVEDSEAHQHQTMDGFGGTLTDSAASVMLSLKQGGDNTRYHDLLTMLFDSNTGIGLNIVRIPIGSSDFVPPTPLAPTLSPPQPSPGPAPIPRFPPVAVRSKDCTGHYSYNDILPGQEDSDLSTFSIERAKCGIIPVLKDIRAINPAVKIIASPWSAPGWMKLGASSDNALFGGRLNPAYYSTYAGYFVKTIQAYELEGIPIDAITVQNEPQNTQPDYPTMFMTADEQATFVGEHLGPALEKAKLPTKIFIYDHNWGFTKDEIEKQHLDPEYVFHVFQNDKARAYIDQYLRQNEVEENRLLS